MSFTVHVQKKFLTLTSCCFCILKRWSVLYLLSLMIFRSLLLVGVSQFTVQTPDVIPEFIIYSNQAPSAKSNFTLSVNYHYALISFLHQIF